MTLKDSANSLCRTTQSLRETIDSLTRNALAYKETLAVDMRALKEDFRGVLTDGLDKIVAHFDHVNAETPKRDQRIDLEHLIHSRRSPRPDSFVTNHISEDVANAPDSTHFIKPLNHQIAITSRAYDGTYLRRKPNTTKKILTSF